jgi:hypothetical protein
MCDLPAVPTAHQDTLFSCRSGVGDAFMNLVEIVENFSNRSDPRLCNWTGELTRNLYTIHTCGSVATKMFILHFVDF